MVPMRIQGNKPKGKNMSKKNKQKKCIKKLKRNK